MTQLRPACRCGARGGELNVKATLSGDQIWNDEFLLKMFALI